MSLAHATPGAGAVVATVTRMTCANCSAPLHPEWKYCIRCGTAVERASAAIPSAIRPEPDDEDEQVTPNRRIDVPLLLGIALAIAGVVLIGFVIVTLSGRS